VKIRVKLERTAEVEVEELQAPRRARIGCGLADSEDLVRILLLRLSLQRATKGREV
jgi:hypothetical protein